MVLLKIKNNKGKFFNFLFCLIVVSSSCKNSLKFSFHCPKGVSYMSEIQSSIH